jgi:EAL domain-containing protein (putative c-di-GMP-specific phosphodiesterase class I)
VLGCDLAQGYYISPALPIAAFEDWLQNSSWRRAHPANAVGG